MAQAKSKSQKTPKNTSKMVKNMKNPQKNFKFLKKFFQKIFFLFWKSRFLVDFTPEILVSMGVPSLYGDTPPYLWSFWGF